MRVLVIDDNEIFRVGLVKILEGAQNVSSAIGYFNNELLVKAAEFKPDVILLDIPEKDSKYWRKCKKVFNNPIEYGLTKA